MKRVDDMADVLAQIQVERCASMHDAIRGGRTRLEPFGVLPSLAPELPPLRLYNCPHCDTTLSRPYTEETK